MIVVRENIQTLKDSEVGICKYQNWLTTVLSTLADISLSNIIHR